MSNIYKVRFMRFKKGQESGKQAPLAEPGAKLVRIQSGEVEEPPGAPFVGQGRCQRGKCQRFGIAGFIVCPVA